MIPLFTSIMLSVASASENPDELNGQFQAQAMMPMVYTSLGIESLFFVAAASQSGLDGAILFATGTVMAAGVTGIGVGLGMSGNRKMIADLESKGIDVETKYFQYAKWSRNLMAGSLVAAIGAMNTSGIDELFLLPPLFAIPMVVYTEKQRRVTLSTYESVAGSGDQSDDKSFQVSLVPTSNGLSLVGTF